MLVDSHCHLDRLDLAPFGGDLAQVLEFAKSNDVTHLLSVGIDLLNWERMVRLTEPYPYIALSVGVHPNEHCSCAPKVTDLVALSRGESRVVAIGETGLDYYYGHDHINLQQDRFRTHIAAARTIGKPLIVHTRNAREDTLRILQEEGAQEIGGVLHCFTEDWLMAERALNLNFHISFSGIVTFKNAKQIQEVARQVPDERLLVETDSPYLAPAPHRGKSNHPAWVRHIAEFIAHLRGQSLDQVAAVTSTNYFRLFGVQAMR